MKQTITSGKAASFFLSADQADAVRSWYFTPARLKKSGMQVVTPEERARIESELGVKNVETFRCSRVQCKCGSTYGAYEFLQEGVREHGADLVKAVFSRKNFTILRANSPHAQVCPNCGAALQDSGGFEYDCDDYGGCCYEE